MKLSPRESMLALLTGAAILFGVSGMWAIRRVDAWKQLRQQQAKLEEEVAADEDLVASRQTWSAEFETLRGNLPEFSPETKMDVHWLSVMGRAASQHGFRISRQQVAEEVRVGDVYELPIECKDWEGTLDSLVHFLFDLQKEGAMLDVRQLQIRPNNNSTKLRGRFLLYCAYTRGPGMEEK
jgi:Tfp pilus assembly protein PilO